VLFVPAPILIVAYDSRWPTQAAADIEALRAALSGRLLAIEHIGSTSVPGLAAKPILDLMAGLRSLDAARACIPLVEALGYRHEPEDTLPDRVYFNKGPEGARSHHLNLVEFEGEFWVRHLAFRNALRTDAGLAADYAALKRRLAAHYGADRLGYTDAKTGFIEAAVTRYLSQQASDPAS
jgi:GrpB-like predicted nucleotidyltransferase (UPF0157 family)